MKMRVKMQEREEFESGELEMLFESKVICFLREKALVVVRYVVR